jgi:hypothetical protein
MHDHYRPRTYLMSVDGVIHDTPSDSAYIHWGGDRPVYSASDSRPSEQGSPIESKA